ncbi:MAG: hypothetical protein LBO69_07160 [Ignavibacteria bacterium]|jgi:hypothetical protein|nr:hypothetical protein [Ignavibacteria bacterium]
MATYTLTLDAQTAEGQHILAFLNQNKDYVSLRESSANRHKLIPGLDEAIEDIKRWTCNALQRF